MTALGTTLDAMEKGVAVTQNLHLHRVLHDASLDE